MKRNRRSVKSISVGVYTTTFLLVMVDKVKGGGRAGWAGFTIMMECTQESGYHASLFVLSRLLLSISVESSLVPLRSSQPYELKRKMLSTDYRNMTFVTY
jgi:hypothetical protein